MISSSASQLRAPLLGLRSHSILFSSTPPPTHLPSPSHFSTKPLLPTHRPKPSPPLPLPSTTIPTRPSSTSTPTTIPPTSTLSPQSPPSLTWNAYFLLRRSRRRYNLLSSTSTSILTIAGGLTILNRHFDSLGSFFGLENPVITFLIGIGASAGVGWLTGPLLGTAVFNLVHKRVRGEMAAKEKDFYNRIKRFRVDPSRQSYQNPLPDYYGEKIGSVAEYRTWMKDQRGYNRKRLL